MTVDASKQYMQEIEIIQPTLILPFALQAEELPAIAPKTAALRSGALCPFCKKAKIDYDGLLNLSCPECGFSGGSACHT
jgi:hypothetical protein